jgi:hypothetical protein
MLIVIDRHRADSFKLSSMFLMLASDYGALSGLPRMTKIPDLAQLAIGGAFSSGSFALLGQGLLTSTDRERAEQISGFILRKRSPDTVCRDLCLNRGLNGPALIEQRSPANLVRRCEQPCVRKRLRLTITATSRCVNKAATTHNIPLGYSRTADVL